tara:strand:- start:1871 stop:2068 length:198 start_codon:yes stop_codon:yes gene_type:complete
VANPAIVIGGRIIAGAASALYNSVTGASKAHAPAATFDDDIRSKQPLKRPKHKGRKANSSAEKFN